MFDGLHECEHWRGEIIRGVAKKIAEIQNAALGEHRIRDLNDEINKDLREKGYWEDQIKALGGADYKSAPRGDVETYGAELAAHSGYKYFGAAKDLDGKMGPDFGRSGQNRWGYNENDEN
eukprot:s3857_g2.t1